MITRFFIRQVPLRIVRRFEDDNDVRTEIFDDRGFEWRAGGSIFLRIVGMGGDGDQWREMTLKQAREIMGVVIPEHFTRADKFLFDGLPDDAIKTVPKKKADLSIR